MKSARPESLPPFRAGSHAEKRLGHSHNKENGSAVRISNCLKAFAMSRPWWLKAS